VTISEKDTWTILRDVVVTTECLEGGHLQKPTTLKTLGNSKRGTKKVCLTCNKIRKKNELLRARNLGYTVEDCVGKVYTIRCGLCGAKFTRHWSGFKMTVLDQDKPHMGCTREVELVTNYELYPEVTQTRDLKRMDTYQSGEDDGPLPGIESFDLVTKFSDYPSAYPYTPKEVYDAGPKWRLPTSWPQPQTFPSFNLPSLNSSTYLYGTTFPELVHPHPVGHAQQKQYLKQQQYQQQQQQNRQHQQVQSGIQIIPFSTSELITQLPYEKLLVFDTPADNTSKQMNSSF